LRIIGNMHLFVGTKLLM